MTDRGPNGSANKRPESEDFKRESEVSAHFLNKGYWGNMRYWLIQHVATLVVPPPVSSRRKEQVPCWKREFKPKNNSNNIIYYLWPLSPQRFHFIQLSYLSLGESVGMILLLTGNPLGTCNREKKSRLISMMKTNAIYKSNYPHAYITHCILIFTDHFV